MTHAELQAALEGLHGTVGAAEAHGWLCGALCVRVDYGVPDWLGDLTEGTVAGAGQAAAGPELQSLHAQTRASLDSPDFTFMPLLPDEEASLDDRVAALAAWCGGFLYGIGSGGAGDRLAKAGHVAEFLGDLAAIAGAELGPGPQTDGDEADFAELVEFVRAGAQLSWEELAELRASVPQAGAAVH